MPMQIGNPSKATAMTPIPTGALQILMTPPTKMVPTTTPPPVSEPLDLLALYAPRPAEPNDDRGNRRDDGAPGHHGSQDSHYRQNRAINAKRVHDLWEVLQRPSLQRDAHNEATDPEPRAPGYGPPAGRG